MSPSSCHRQPILVSACLLGVRCRYDGKSKSNQAVLDYLDNNNLVAVPVCPEQLAGMPTPREATRFLSGDGSAVLDDSGQVISASGRDMNAVFQKGARETLRIARLTGCRQAIMKERSPSCGVHRIHRGQGMVDGMGVTTALLIREGIPVRSEENF